MVGEGPLWRCVIQMGDCIQCDRNTFLFVDCCRLRNALPWEGLNDDTEAKTTSSALHTSPQKVGLGAREELSEISAQLRSAARHPQLQSQLHAAGVSVDWRAPL